MAGDKDPQGLTKEEKQLLEELLPTWRQKTKKEKAKAKEEVIDQVLEGRQLTVDDPMYRGFFRNVSGLV